MEGVVAAIWLAEHRASLFPSKNGTAANAHDLTLPRATLQSMPVRRPKPQGRRRQHCCLDNGYVAKPTEKLASRLKYILHVSRKGEDQVKRRRERERRLKTVVRGG